MNPSTITPAAAPPATPAAPASDPAWSIEDARLLYNIEGWGLGYFDINARGRAVVRPDRARPDRELDLFEMATDLAAQGVGLPMLLRFSDILRSRIETLTVGFRDAMKEFAYDGGYTLVYPVKVNQQRHVVEEIVQFGSSMGVGLECGSKPELQIVLAMSEARRTRSSAMATRTKSSCGSRSWARSSATACSSSSSR